MCVFYGKIWVLLCVGVCSNLSIWGMSATVKIKIM